MRKILFIINRKAGTDREKRLEDTIREHLPASEFDVQITHLAYLGHGTHLAQEAVKQGIDTVVAVGGDGSINEIAQGLTGTQTALAIIPLGSGNGLARALKIPLNVNKALALIAKGHRGAIDAGYADGYLFLSNAGVGFDALIAEKFRNMHKRGLQGYAKLVIKSFREYKDNVYTVNIDGAQTLEKPAFLMSMANGNQLGYEFKLSPQADLFDGLLDVCIVPPVSFFGLLPLCIHSLLGTVHKTKYMQRYTGRNITISSPKLTYLQVDGDAVPLKTNGHVEFKVVKGALQVIVNN